MEKLPTCRICLVQNVRMFVVVNRNLRELYEKLTDIPFVTDDSRPILACFFCCAKLKQCYRLLRQCLAAEELFTQMMNEDYEPNSLINRDHLEFSSGFIKSPTENISIVDGCQTESVPIKEELPAVCERLDDVIEPKEEHLCVELETENLDNSCLDAAHIPPHHSESDLEDDVPLMEFKTEVEEEQDASKTKGRARETRSTKIKCSFSRRHLFELWCSQKPSNRKKYVLEVFLASLKNPESVDITPLTHRIVNLCRSLEKFWVKSARTKDRVLNNYSDWLDENECVELTRSVEQCHLHQEQPRPSRAVVLREDFPDLSTRSKRRRLSELSQVGPSAVNTLLKTSGQSNRSNLTMDISSEEVLSLTVEAKLSKRQYLLIRNLVNSKTSCNILPSYQSVLLAKEKCYPENISVSETNCEVELHTLSDHHHQTSSKEEKLKLILAHPQ